MWLKGRNSDLHIQISLIKVKRRKMIFEVSLLDLDQPFVKLVAKLMGHPVVAGIL